MALPGKLVSVWIDMEERAMAGMHRIGMRTGLSPIIAPHLRTGLLGERAAMFELLRRGVVVVARRWTSTRMRGDIDLIGWDGDALCFFEVKTRTAKDMRPAEWAVDETKRRMVRGLARAYLRNFPEKDRRTIPVRFDVISVYMVGGAKEFEFFPNAFGWS